MRLSSSAIYKILNKVTADFYIGSAVNFSTRRSVHLHWLKKNQHHSPILQNSWNKHGEDAFEFIMIELVEDKTKLIEREQFYIDTLKPRYNCNLVAGSPLGVKHTEESRLNMSKAHKGLTKEQRGHKVDCNCCFCKRPKGKDNPRYIAREIRSCVCGCKTEFEVMINSTKKYVSGHNGRKRK